MAGKFHLRYRKGGEQPGEHGLSECRAWLGPTGSWSKEQCRAEWESEEAPTALWAASNGLKEPEVQDMDPWMMMARPKDGVTT